MPDFEKYFDHDFNFTNRVSKKRSDRKSLQNFDCGGGVMLEPRLQEYVKRKKMYHENGIEPVTPLEREYMITENDKKRISAFFKGQQNLYDTKKYPLEDREKPKKQYFPSKGLHDDRRVLKPKKPSMDPVPNRGMFAPEANGSFYDDPIQPFDHPLDARDLNRSNGQPIESLLDDQTSIGRHRTIDPRNRFAQPEIAGGCAVSDRIEGGRLHGNESDWNPYTEFNLQTPTPEQRYEPVNWPHSEPKPQYRGSGRGRGDVGVETAIQYSMPTRTSKSFGYENPNDHYYDFITDDIQDPEHVVFPIPRGGVSTRLNNKRSARSPKSREIY